jgi:uncharacterized membrane protein
MIWLKILHIATIAAWCGLLLYLPAVVAINTGERSHLAAELKGEVFARYLFTLIATPIALAAIVSGTLLFLFENNIAGWLLAKLMVVTALVLCHLLCGWLVLRVERDPGPHRTFAVAALATVTPALILVILYLVLARP